MATQPPEIDPFPPEPQRGNKDTFADLFDGVITWFGNSVSKIGQACQAAYQNAVEAAASALAAAASADAAVTAAGAVQWVSGTSYVKGKVVWSPLNARTYRRLVAGAGTTDPSLDKANWTTLSFEPPLLATFIISSAVANIDFLNIFSAEFDRYTIEIQGLVTTGGGADLQMSLAVAGAIVSSSNYAGPTYSEQSLGTSNPRFMLGQITSGPSLATNLTINVRNVNASSVKSVGVRGNLVGSGYTSLISAIREGAFTGASPVSGFRLNPSAGTFAGGVVRVFGHRNS
jgi:hypothetical protein